MRILYFAFWFIPQNLLSWLTGFLARLRLPSPLGKWFNRLFVRVFSIDMTEVELPLDEFETIEDIFTRKLRPGSRVIEADFCSPADGFLVYSAPVKADRAIQAKGIDYDPMELCYGELSNSASTAHWYQTVYLAPHNYHRVHSPVGGKLTTFRYIPGRLWPVNQPFVGVVPQLFNANERLVFEIETTSGAKVWVVMVGALNVGRIESHFLPGFASNIPFSPRRHPVHEIVPNEEINVNPGDELGVFLLGSTVVTVFEEGALPQGGLVEVNGETKVVEMGQSFLRGQQ